VASFAQHIKRREGRTPRRLTWVCGADPWLRAFTVSDLVSRYLVPDGHVSWHDAGTKEGLSSFWSGAFQYQIEQSHPRVVVLSQAEKVSVTEWKRLNLWVSEMRTQPKLFLIFNSADPKLDTEQLHVSLIRDKGDVIRCASVSEAALFTWQEDETPLRAGTINAVIKRMSADPRRVHQLCEKLTLFGDARPEHVVALAEESVLGDFVDYVILGDTHRAMALAHTVEPRSVLGLLEYRLAQMIEMHRAARTSTHAQVPIYVQHQFDRVAGRYSPGKVAHVRDLLVVIDEAVHQGEARGAMEVLVRCW